MRVVADLRDHFGPGPKLADEVWHWVRANFGEGCTISHGRMVACPETSRRSFGLGQEPQRVSPWVWVAGAATVAIFAGVIFLRGD